MEWFALLIPVISIPLMRILFPHKVVWWELFLPILPPLLLIPIIKFSAETAITNDYERWGGWAIEVRYYEDWNEYIHKTCTRQVSDGTDSKGNPKYKTETYDCSYVDYHPEYWELLGSNGEQWQISKSEYNKIKAKFGNNTFVDMRRYYHTNDGDMYKSIWSGKDDSFIPIFSEHRYRNKVQASRGVFEYKQIDKETKALLHKFPNLPDKFNDPPILGQHNQPAADKLLQYYNAKLGARYQIRYWILLFKNQPRSIGLEQEALWKGGNKNEFVLCINTDSTNKPTWCHGFCWSPDGYAGNDIMKIEMRDFVESQEFLDLIPVVEKMVEETGQNWKRKQFAEFEYLKVDLPSWVIVLIYILTMLTTGGVCFFVVVNEISEPAMLHGRSISSEFWIELKERIYTLKSETSAYWQLKDKKNKIIFQFRRIKSWVASLFKRKP